MISVDINITILDSSLFYYVKKLSVVYRFPHTRVVNKIAELSEV